MVRFQNSSSVLSKQTDNGTGFLLEGLIFSLEISSRVVLKGMILLFGFILGI